MNKTKTLIVSAHPDDEVIGCGGTILKLKEQGSELYWLIITNVSEQLGWDKDFVLSRQKEIDIISQMLVFNKVYKLDYPTTQLDTIPLGDLIKKISSVINEIMPNEIFVVNRSDVHTDHKIVFQAVYSCTKNFRFPFVKKILMYECLSETEFSPALIENVFIPNTFVDITDFFDRKLEIAKTYKSEIMDDFLPRSLSTIESLARYRGSRIGVKYAEAFQLIFEER
ncbi:MAG: PIG-L family deacetylase [Bacteroidetes bacterium]|nr:PIG-L family deacetylase [Bacteroidota bacterium]